MYSLAEARFASSTGVAVFAISPFFCANAMHFSSTPSSCWIDYLGCLDGKLTGREFLLDRFTIADAYLFTVLNWRRATGMDYAEYPAITA